MLVAPFFFFGGWVSRAGPALTAGAGFFGRSGPCPRWWLSVIVGDRQHRPTLERPGRRSHAGAWERSPRNPRPRGGRLAPPGGWFGAGRVSGEEEQPFGAEPVGGVRNREKGASCLSAASSCPAGSAARRPGSSQRQGCPFFWFFSLGRQRKERHPAGGRWHFGGAGTSGAAFSGWRVGRIRDQADRL